MHIVNIIGLKLNQTFFQFVRMYMQICVIQFVVVCLQ